MKKYTFKNLVFLARQESCPQVDITESVMYKLALMTANPIDPYRAYRWVGSISGAIAACILITISLFRYANSDPINEIITYVSWVAQ